MRNCQSLVSRKNIKSATAIFIHAIQVITNVSHALPSHHFLSYPPVLTTSFFPFIASLIHTTCKHYCKLTEISTWRLHHVHLLLLSDDILTITMHVPVAHMDTHAVYSTRRATLRWFNMQWKVIFPLIYLGTWYSSFTVCYRHCHQLHMYAVISISIVAVFL